MTRREGRLPQRDGDALLESSHACLFCLMPSPMKVPELLAPAGDPGSFNVALAAGADAIYCALGNDFNARRKASNFTPDSFEAACQRAHLAGVRVYVTTNIVIKSEEMPRALALAREAWLLGADALIIQDWGLLFELRHRFPQMEIHLSTQANVHDARAVAWCRGLGVARVTLSRELSVDEISRISQEGIELEGFAHGALCFCYSGVCLMSSLAGGRSANRGLCAQPCRLPYRLVDESAHDVSAPNRRLPLCPKDYCTIDQLGSLSEAGLDSIKLEGRMKAPDYVYAVVRSYRAQLDDLAVDRTPTVEEGVLRHERLRRAFNRDFTHSYLDGRADDDMMSYERSNNRGRLVGRVVASRDCGGAKLRRGGANGGRERFRLKRLFEVDVLLDSFVGGGDLLEIRPASDPTKFLTTTAPADAKTGSVICCKAVRPMESGSLVRVICSRQAMNEATRLAAGGERRKRLVTVRVLARLGKPFVVELACVDGTATARVEDFVVEPARTKAVSEQDLTEHVGRMGHTPFVPASIEVECDAGCGLSFSAVHRVRSKACELLEREVLEPYSTVVRGRNLAHAPDGDDVALQLRLARQKTGGRKPVPVGEVEICALVPTPEIADAASRAGATRMYVTPDALAEAKADGAPWPSDAALIPWLDEVCREADHRRLDSLVRRGEACAVGNVSELALAVQRGAAAEIRPCIPVHNESCLTALETAGAMGLWFSPELTLDEVCALGRVASIPCGLIVSGRTQAMTSEHCVLQTTGHCLHDCAACELRRGRHFLRDRNGRLLPVRTDLEGRSHIYAARPLDATPELGRLLAAGITRLMADCTLLSAEETTCEVARIVRALAAVAAGRRPAKRMGHADSGHLYEPIA